jgi:formate-dependent nitrite reductase membrane component NrfD
MSTSDVTKDGQRGLCPGRETSPGREAGRRGRRGEQAMVPPAEFESYYGKPVINSPVWESRDIAGYFFLGGLAGVSSLMGAGAHATGRPALATAAKTGAFGAACVSVVGLIHDLGRPARFLNMMRVLKVTSPMSVGTWILGAYVPVTGVAVASALTGRASRLGAAATAGAALLGPVLATYTGVLISDTAVPAWHDGYRELPFVFAGSGAAAAGGLGLLTAPAGQNAPAGNLALLGAAAEAAAFELMTKRMGMVAEPFSAGRARVYLRVSQALSAVGSAGALFGRRNRVVAALSGAALLGASAATRWSVFHAGLASAADPRYTVLPQRKRRDGMKTAPGEAH